MKGEKEQKKYPQKLRVWRFISVCFNYISGRCFRKPVAKGVVPALPAAGKPANSNQEKSGGVIKRVINVDEVKVRSKAKGSSERKNFPDFVAVRIHPNFHVKTIQVKQTYPPA
jgi:hypothetical protein